MTELVIDNTTNATVDSGDIDAQTPPEPSTDKTCPIGGETLLVPLDHLIASPDNVRTLRPKKDPADKQLIASILATGVIQNLIVIAASDGREQYEVVAGERRRLALAHLAATGAIEPDTPVRCVVRERIDAVAVSLAENDIRKAMHPADRHAAYAQLIKDGASEADVARQHGITASEVRQILRLSALAPALLKYFRSDRLSFDTALAFASTPDQTRQRAVFKALGGRPDVSPHAVRNALRQTRAVADSAAALFVGLDAYREAGGLTEDDLFEGTTHLVDLPLLSRLVDEQLERAAALLTGWGWVETAYPEQTNLYRYARLPRTAGEVPETLATELASLKEREATLNATDGGDLTEEQDAEYDAVFERIDAIESIIDSEHSHYDEADRLHAGCIVSFHPTTGELAVHKGLQRPEDRRARREAQADADGTSDELMAFTQPKAPGVFARDMGLYRRAAIRATLARTPDTALTLLHFHLCVNAFGGYALRSDLFSLHGEAVRDETSRDDIDQTQARQHLAERIESLDLHWIEKDDIDRRFAAFMALSRPKREALVACAAALTLVAGDNVQHDDVPARITSELSVDYAAEWRPTRANYFERLKKDDLMALGIEWYGDTFRDQHRQSSKKALVDHFARVFECDATALDKRDRAFRETWIPASLN